MYYSFNRPLSICQRVLFYRIVDALDNAFGDQVPDFRHQFLRELELAVYSVNVPDSLYEYELEHLYDDLLSERGDFV